MKPFSIFILTLSCGLGLNAQTNPPPDVTKPHQIVTTNKPPLSPEKFSPDTGRRLPSPRQSPEELKYRRRYLLDRNRPAAAPSVFNPDPGGGTAAPPAEPFYKTNYGVLPEYKGEPVEKSLELPRQNVERSEIVPMQPMPPRCGAISKSFSPILA